jgi:hypothetical protein
MLDIAKGLNVTSISTRILGTTNIAQLFQLVTSEVKIGREFYRQEYQWKFCLKQSTQW